MAAPNTIRVDLSSVVDVHPRHFYVLVQVAAERLRQDERWGEQNHPDGTGTARSVVADVAADHARNACEVAFATGNGTWRHILLEEVYEALAEADPQKLRTELIQVAAVATAWVEAIDRRGAQEGEA